MAQAILSIIERDQLDVGAQQVLVRRDDAEVLDLGGLGCGFGRDFAHNELVGAGPVGIAQEAETAGGVGLRVAVDEQGLGAVSGKGRGKVNRRGGFAHAALLIGNCDDPAHAPAR